MSDTVTLDQATDIRAGEELDMERVTRFLRQTLPGFDGRAKVLQFPSGFSNLTYLIEAPPHQLVLRKPPHGKKAKTAHDMQREFRILTALAPVFPYAPKPIAYSDDPAILGTPFYIMERIQGIIPRKNLPKGLVLTPEQAGKLCENMVAVLCELHALDYEAVGLGDFGKPEGYVRRQVEGWSRRYRDARTPDAPDYEGVMAWLAAHMPLDSPWSAIIHNDYKFDNLVLDAENPLTIIGVLDWEMATLGDPLMDLGSSLAYWIDHDDPEDMQLIRMLPTTLPGMPTRSRILEEYLTRMQQINRITPATKKKLMDGGFDFYYCFGLFRLAVIAQQIYWRFYHGQTRDKRFQMLIVAVQVLEKACQRILDRSAKPA